MSTGILVLVGLGVFFGILAFFTLKKSKKVVTPTYEETPTPRLSFDPSIKEPEPTPVPQEPEVIPVPTVVDPIHQLCWGHRVIVSNAVETICQSQEEITVYTCVESILESTQLFMSEESCKFNRPNWSDQFNHVKYSGKYCSVDTEGRVLGFLDCIE
jgi:hypothetical protein